jgi:hypothetical protein
MNFFFLIKEKTLVSKDKSFVLTKNVNLTNFLLNFVVFLVKMGNLGFENFKCSEKFENFVKNVQFTSHEGYFEMGETFTYFEKDILVVDPIPFKYNI